MFGTLFRVGRQGGARTWPVGGGTLAEAGMATPRAISFNKAGNEMVGHTGQTSTQIVILTQAAAIVHGDPAGRERSSGFGHWDDQAEKLFSKSQAKPTYFVNRKELEKHVTAKKELSSDNRSLKSCEEISWQAKAPAKAPAPPRHAHVGIISQLLTVAARIGAAQLGKLRPQAGVAS